ncbi:MAG: hypothetical protein JKY95_16360, partial [Planctomycetaceae bacterium]|nr:hypothetical protein [Planctomycetaceae bacterium]
MSLRKESTSANSKQDQPWQVRLARDANEQVQSLSLMIQENDPEVKRQEVEKIQKLHQEGKLDINKILVA